MIATDSATSTPQLRGTIVKGRERIASWAAMSVLRCEMKHVASLMRSLGWQGPIKARALDASGKPSVISCYERDPLHVVDVVPSSPPDVVGEELPARLERVTLKGLSNLEEVLDRRFDPKNAGLMKAKVTAASVAIQAQLRADEQRLRTKVTGDVLAKLLKIIESERNQHRGAHPTKGNHGADDDVTAIDAHSVTQEPIEAIDDSQADGDGQPHEGTEPFPIADVGPETLDD